MLLQEQSLLLRQQANSRRAEETKHTHSETNAINTACTVPDCLAHFFKTLQVCDGESDRKY